MPCAEGSKRAEAYFDGELDSHAAADFEQHIEECAECRSMLADLELMRGALRREFTFERTPVALRARIMHRLDGETSGKRLSVAAGDTVTQIAVNPGAGAAVGAGGSGAGGSGAGGTVAAVGAGATVGAGGGAGANPGGASGGAAAAAGSTAASGGVAAALQAEVSQRAFWWGASGGFAAAAVIALLAAIFFGHDTPTALVDELVSAHIRSLMPAHLVDIEARDGHAVKPWFAGHADVSPTVADFAAQGYRLVGGRVDYFAHQRAAALVYEHGAHLINVLSWAAANDASPPRDTTRNGYQLTCWRSGNLDSCAVSDTGAGELKTLRTLIERAGATES